MNEDQVSGKVDQATGKVKEKAGEAIGNDKLANEGRANQVKGVVKEAWGNTKEAGKNLDDALTDKDSNKP